MTYFIIALAAFAVLSAFMAVWFSDCNSGPAFIAHFVGIIGCVAMWAVWNVPLGSLAPSVMNYAMNSTGKRIDSVKLNL